MPTSQATLLVISGVPCTGKSALAREFETKLRWPVLCKDETKELLFAALGWSDREWSRKLSDASYALVFATARKLLANGTSCVLEGNFRRARHPDFLELIRGIDVRRVQVLCKAPGDVIVERFLARAQSGTRHPGHVDMESFAELESELRSGIAEPLPIGGTVLDFDATHVSTELITRFVEQAISGLTS